MNSSVQDLPGLVFRAFKECSTQAELAYAAKALGDVFVDRRETIAQLLETYLRDNAIGNSAGNKASSMSSDR